jgi:hypothetical protein
MNKNQLIYRHQYPHRRPQEAMKRKKREPRALFVYKDHTIRRPILLQLDLDYALTSEKMRPL